MLFYVVFEKYEFPHMWYKNLTMFSTFFIKNIFFIYPLTRFLVITLKFSCIVNTAPKHPQSLYLSEIPSTFLFEYSKAVVTNET